LPKQKKAPAAPVVTGPDFSAQARPTWNWDAVPDATNYRHSFTDGSGWVETTELSYTPGSDLTNGFHTLYVQAGNANRWSASDSWTIEVDTTLPPAPTITGITSGSYKTTQSFTLTGILANATAEYSLNNGTDWIEYTVKVDITDEGNYQVVARQTDEFSKTSPTSSPSIDITIDVTEPDPPAGLDLAAADDTGSSNSDNITNQTTGLTISGSSEANAIIDFYSDIDGSLGNISANGTGNWSMDVTLTAAVHSLSATQTDLAGNTSGDSSALGLTIDTTASVAPAGLDLSATDDSGSSTSDNITNQTTGLTISGSSEANASIDFYSDIDGYLGNTSADGSGNWSMDVSLIAAVHSISATQTDLAGNTSGSSPGLSITIDTTDPVVSAKFSTADRIIAIDTTDSANFTGESATTSSWDSGTNELTLTDPAGNTRLMSQAVYQGAEGDGLRTAVETDAADGEIIYLCAGTYTLTNNRIQILYSLTLRGDGSAVTRIVQPTSNQRLIEVMTTGKSVSIEHMELDAVNRECIFTSAGIVVDLFVRDLCKGPNATGREFVDIPDNGSTARYWNGSSYTAAADGVDGWVIATSVNISFTAAQDTTYWQ